MLNFDKLKETIRDTKILRFKGYVTEIVGLTIYAQGPKASVGELVYIQSKKDIVPAEVQGFKENKTMLMPFGDMSGIAPGDLIISSGDFLKVKVGPGIVGRVLNGLGEPIDGKGEFAWEKEYPLYQEPPHPLKRKRITEALSLGVKAIDGLLTCGSGQRLGIFAGSGVGKSTLLGMIARNSSADFNVIALIGEREEKCANSGK